MGCLEKRFSGLTQQCWVNDWTPWSLRSFPFSIILCFLYYLPVNSPAFLILFLLVLQEDFSLLHPLFQLPSLQRCLKYPNVTQWMLIFRQISKAPQARAGRSGPFEDLLNKRHRESCVGTIKTFPQSWIPTFFSALGANINTREDHSSDVMDSDKVNVVHCSLTHTVLSLCSAIKENPSLHLLYWH